ncbi:MAG: hypothetical protein ABJP33_11130 [Pseudoruegeria sp.]
MPNHEVLATVKASPARRGFAVAVLASLGALLLYIDLTNPPAILGWQVFLFVVGAFVLWGAFVVSRATQETIELTTEGLRESNGRLICRMEDIKDINRGVFAMKPSNGFMIHVRSSERWTWAPGLWWRFAGRVGVGGVTAANQAKGMSEIIATILAQREEDNTV